MHLYSTTFPLHYKEHGYLFYVLLDILKNFYPSHLNLNITRFFNSFIATTFLLLSLRTAVRLWLSPGCMARCLSTDSYTNLFQRSPLWWEIQTLWGINKMK